MCAWPLLLNSVAASSCFKFIGLRGRKERAMNPPPLETSSQVTGAWNHLSTESRAWGQSQIHFRSLLLECQSCLMSVLCLAGRGLHPGASVLYNHGVHDVWEPAGLPARVQPAGGERCGAAVHGHADLVSHGVPGEEKLHPQVGACCKRPHPEG